MRPAGRRLLLVLACAFAAEAAAQSPAPPPEPPLLPGCALPPPRLMADAAPLEVELGFAATPAGDVSGVELIKGSGRPELDAAFVDAARACRMAAVHGAGAEAARARGYRLRYRFDGGSLPTGIHGCFPVPYPALALRREEEGTSTLLLRVPADGAAPEVRLASPSGSKTLDEQALLLAGSCLANPGVRAALEPDRWYRQSVRWVLQ